MEPTMLTPAAEPVAPLTEESGSLADHEAQFSGRRGARTQPTIPDDPSDPANPRGASAGIEPLPAEDAPAAPRHRAKSQQARVEDVPAINALTKELREKEAALFKLKPANGEPSSARVVALRRQIRGLEAELADAQPREPRAVDPVLPRVPQPAAPSTFTDPEPKIEEFSAEADPYAAWNRALARWDRKKERAEEEARQVTTQSASAAAAAQQRIDETYRTRATAFLLDHPDFDARIAAAGDVYLPPLALVALKTLDRGPELVYNMTQHPQLFAELHLLTDGKPVTEQTVASAQRWLAHHVPAVSTTAAAVTQKPLKSPSKPPTVVRTGPITTGDDPPADGASLADHEAFFHARRRR